MTVGRGVTIGYSLSGASIPPDAKTFSVAYFPNNNAPMVELILSMTLTDALIDKFTRQTRLAQVDEGGRTASGGRNHGLPSTTASVASDDYALLNRLSITVKVRFTNVLDEAMSSTNPSRPMPTTTPRSCSRRWPASWCPKSDQLVNDILPGCGLQLVTAMATFTGVYRSLGSGRRGAGGGAGRTARTLRMVCPRTARMPAAAGRRSVGGRPAWLRGVQDRAVTAPERTGSG